MTLDQMIYFSEVYQQRSISIAAVNLNISQQSLSSSIQQLEKELSTILFIRSAKGTFPTKEGESFYESVQIIIAELYKFQKKSSLPENEICKIGFPSAFPTVANDVYYSLFKTFNDVMFEMQPFHFNDLTDLSATGALDIIFTFLTKKELARLEYLLPAEYKMKYISKKSKTMQIWLSKNSPFAKNSLLTAAEVSLSDFVSPYYLYNCDSFSFYFSPQLPIHIHVAHTKEIFLDYIERYNFVSPDICDDNTPLVFPELLEKEHLKLVPLSNEFPKLYFVLIYKKTCERYYLHISKLLSKIYN